MRAARPFLKVRVRRVVGCRCRTEGSQVSLRHRRPRIGSNATDGRHRAFARPEPEDLRSWPVNRTSLEIATRKKTVAVGARRRRDQDPKLRPSGRREVTATPEMHDMAGAFARASELSNVPTRSSLLRGGPHPPMRPARRADTHKQPFNFGCARHLLSEVLHNGIKEPGKMSWMSLFHVLD
jgi:hypothetical protein